MPGPAPSVNSPLARWGNAAGKFDHFDSALNVALGIGNDLAVLRRQHMGEFVHMLFDQRLEIEHNACTFLRVLRRPFRKHALSGFDGDPDFARRGEWRSRLNFACSGVEDVAEAPARPFDVLAADEVVQFSRHVDPPKWRARRARLAAV